MPIADTAISVTKIVGRLASFGDQGVAVAEFVGGFLPGSMGRDVLAATKVAAPIIHQISLAAPTVVQTIEAGRPILDAIQQAGPHVLPLLKQLYAGAVNHDPKQPQTSMSAEHVSDKAAIEFAAPVFLGRAWTAEEESRWFDKAKGDVSNA